MARCRVDTSIERKTIDGYEFPLGVYPVEEMTPKEGYTLTFESADADRFEGPSDDFTSDDPGLNEDGNELNPPPPETNPEWEQWPDRYVFDINIRATRVEALCRQLFALLPGRVYPILDVMGNDAYREIDPFIAYELVGTERFSDALRRFRSWFFEDGLVGFGAMADEPFVYVFVDEHKLVTVRVQSDLKDQVERILRAFDLQEVDRIAGADAAVHEHRGVLDAPANRPDLLTHDEIIEELRDAWGLTLNIDPITNRDETGADLGIVPWRCLVRAFSDDGQVRYAEVYLTADSFQTASDLAVDAVQTLDLRAEKDTGGPPAAKLSTKSNPTPPKGDRSSLLDDLDNEDEMPNFDLLAADRIRPEDVGKFPPWEQATRADLTKSTVVSASWLE